MQRTLTLTALVAALVTFNVAYAEQGTDRLRNMFDDHRAQHDAQAASDQSQTNRAYNPRSRQTQ